MEGFLKVAFTVVSKIKCISHEFKDILQLVTVMAAFIFDNIVLKLLEFLGDNIRFFNLRMFTLNP